MPQGADYRVDLSIYNGPLDLLLYLIKEREMDIHDIPIAEITEQFLSHLEVVKRIDIDRAGDFLLLAATLMLIKSRMLLPRPEEED
ncbi:MAG: segregation and condensation protein A, partial [Planctomycetota bacterium]